VVGTLLAAGQEELSVRRRDGSVAAIAVADVETGKVVPPGPARRIGIDELQAVMATGWRALETADCDGWLLRAANGFTGRANSALVTSAPVPDLAGRLDRVQRWYADRGLPAKLTIAVGSTPPGLEQALTAEGWSTAEPDHVLTAEIAHVLRPLPEPAVRAEVDTEPDDAWLGLYRPDLHPLPPAAVAVLRNHPQPGFVSVREGGACIAIARVAVDGRWAGLFGVEVAQSHRRTGIGTAVTAAALRWAVARGARHTYLQVMSSNAAAITFWQRLGFAHHHDYRYCTAPTSSPS
jgi:ribosomal protein S18 acetylase RimI-like enzyme